MKKDTMYKEIAWCANIYRLTKNPEFIEDADAEVEVIEELMYIG